MRPAIIHDETRTSSISMKAYCKLNDSFGRKLVFRVGINAGFFSEYNNMLLAMLYSLDHRIRLVLYSKGANFSWNSGWQDYFLPFGAESRIGRHSHYNYRTQSEYEAARTSRVAAAERLLKLLTRTDYLTHDLFDVIREEAKGRRHYQFPELGIDGGVRTACSYLATLTWRFNAATADAVRNAITTLSLPSEYIGFHIRGGDKAADVAIYGIDAYVRKAEETSKLRSAFVATDDYTNIEKLKAAYPAWTFYHLCREDARGYEQSAFESLMRSKRKQEMLELFTSVEVLARSQLCVCTYTSNIGMYLGLRMPAERCRGLDSDQWYVL